MSYTHLQRASSRQVGDGAGSGASTAGRAGGVRLAAVTLSSYRTRGGPNPPTLRVVTRPPGGSVPPGRGRTGQVPPREREVTAQLS